MHSRINAAAGAGALFESRKGALARSPALEIANAGARLQRIYGDTNRFHAAPDVVAEMSAPPLLQ